LRNLQSGKTPSASAKD
jgi:antitoxin YokJ